MTGPLLIASALLGLAIGSFLNVVVCRVPLGHSLSQPPSACPRCATPIAIRDNIPLVSWLLLRGRCRQCRTGISVRYPMVELMTAVLFVAVALRFGWSWTTPALDAFVAGLVALACIDLERYLLPKKVVYPTLAASALFLLLGTVTDHDWRRLGAAAACGLGAFGLFFVLNLVNPRWLGFGDVRLAGVIGLALGWLGLPYLLVGLLAANLAGIIVAGVLIGVGRLERDSPIPYGVFLSGGSVVAVLAGEPLARLLTTHPV